MERELVVRVIRPGAEVDLVGRLDARTTSSVRDMLHACVDEGEGDLLLHVGSLEIWDSAGLGVLVGAHRRARRAGRRVVLTDVPPRHLRLLKATRLHRLFVVEPLVA
jgi:anti-sigma B factor antagonist